MSPSNPSPPRRPRAAALACLVACAACGAEPSGRLDGVVAAHETGDPRPESSRWALAPGGPGGLKLDLGRAERGQMLRGRFELRNRRERAVEIARVVPSCGCASTRLSASSLAPGETCTLDVEVDTSGVHGRLSANVVLLEEGAAEPLTVCEVVAVVGQTAALYAEPYRLRLEDAGDGEGRTAEFELLGTTLGEGEPTLELLAVETAVAARVEPTGPPRPVARGARTGSSLPLRLRVDPGAALGTEGGIVVLSAAVDGRALETRLRILAGPDPAGPVADSGGGGR